MKNELKINIETSISLPNEPFEDIVNRIMSSEIKDIPKDLLIIGDVEQQIDNIEEEIKRKLLVLRGYRNRINQVKEELKPKLIKFGEETYRTRTWVDHETGEVKSIKEHDLPKGFTFTPSRTKYEYDESLIPNDERYWKKELNKIEVQKSFKNGEIKQGVKMVEGDASVSFNYENMKRGLNEK